MVRFAALQKTRVANLAGYVPPYDATCVQLLTAAGAHIAGKAKMDEFGMG